MGTDVQNFDSFVTPEQSDESLDSLSSYFINRTSSLDAPPNEPNVVALNFTSKRNEKEFDEKMPEVCMGDTNSWLMNRANNNEWIHPESSQDNKCEVYSNGCNFDENDNETVIESQPVLKFDGRPKEDNLTSYKTANLSIHRNTGRGETILDVNRHIQPILTPPTSPGKKDHPLRVSISVSNLSISTNTGLIKSQSHQTGSLFIRTASSSNTNYLSSDQNRKGNSGIVKDKMIILTKYQVKIFKKFITMFHTYSIAYR